MTNGVFSINNTIAPSFTRVLPLFSLKGKTAIVAGAGAGIGLAVAQAYAEAGADVAIWYNANKKAVEKAAAIEKEYGVKCRFFQSAFLHDTSSSNRSSAIGQARHDSRASMLTYSKARPTK